MNSARNIIKHNVNSERETFRVYREAPGFRLGPVKRNEYPSFSTYMASYDVASTIHQSLPRERRMRSRQPLPAQRQQRARQKQPARRTRSRRLRARAPTPPPPGLRRRRERHRTTLPLPEPPWLRD